jgi:hypothetical protein
VIGLVGINAVRRRGWREVGRVIAWSVAGLLIAFVLWQLLLAPLAQILIDIARVNKRIATNRLPPSGVLQMYWDQVIVFGRTAAAANTDLLVGAVAATMARRGLLALGRPCPGGRRRWVVAAQGDSRRLVSAAAFTSRCSPSR